jgi:hypothetical protein
VDAEQLGGTMMEKLAELFDEAATPAAIPRAPRERHRARAAARAEYCLSEIGESDLMLRQAQHEECFSSTTTAFSGNTSALAGNIGALTSDVRTSW